MFKSFEIKNFRGIKTGLIDNLGTVNIFIGKNNSGKSTVLEALYFVTSIFRSDDYFGDYKIEKLMKKRTKRAEMDFRDFSYNYKTDQTIQFTSTFKSVNDINNDLKAKLILDIIPNPYELDVSIKPPEEKIINFRVSLRQEGAAYTTNFGSGSGIRDFIEHYKRNFDDLFRTRTEAKLNEGLIYLTKIYPHLKFIKNGILIDSEFVRTIESVEKSFWKKIFENRVDQQLKRVLNEIYSLKIEGFSFMPYLRDNFKLIALFEKGAIHLDDFGDGFKYAFSILSIGSQLRDTIFLIEEPELHQHSGALSLFLKALVKIGEENNLQIFITTHSFEVLNFLADLNKENLRMFHLNLSLEGELLTWNINGTNLKLFLDLGTDLRYLDEIIKYLIVEGKEDKTFFKEIIKKIHKREIEEFGYKIVLSPKQEQKMVIKSLASIGSKIIVASDYDTKDNYEKRFNQILGTLRNTFKEIESENGTIKVRDTNSQIKIIIMGLPREERLTSIGVTCHSMEDYLLLLLDSDTSVSEWAGTNLKKLATCAKSMKDFVSLNKSKTILSVLGTLKEGLSIEEVITQIIQKSDIKILTEILSYILTQLGF